LSFGSAPSLGYIENSSLEGNVETQSTLGSAPSLGYIENSSIDDNTEIRNDSIANASPISQCAGVVQSNLVSSVNGMFGSDISLIFFILTYFSDESLFEDGGEYYGGFESDEDYSYASVGSLSSLEDNGLTGMHPFFLFAITPFDFSHLSTLKTKEYFSFFFVVFVFAI
jgi:hypothetical protein